MKQTDFVRCGGGGCSAGGAETPPIEPEAAAVTNIWVRLKRDYQQAKTSPKLIQVMDLEIFLRNTYICKKKRVCVGPE